MNHVDSCFVTSLHHRPTSPLQGFPKQRRNPVSKVSDVFFRLIAKYNEFTTVNNRGGGQSDWPLPLIYLTTPALLGPPHPQITSFRPLRPPRTSMDDFTPPNDHIPHPSPSPHCEHAGTLPLTLLSDSWPLPPLLVPSNKRAAIAPLYLPSPPPRSGLHHSEAGDAVGGHKHRLK